MIIVSYCYLRHLGALVVHLKDIQVSIVRFQVG